MAPHSLGFWMLFLWIQKGVSAGGENSDCGNATGILGKAVELKCCYPGKNLTSNPFRVQWQLEGIGDCVVAAYLPDQNDAPRCERYENRTELKKDNLHLWLLNISLEDNKIYECILQKRKGGKYEKIFQGLIKLYVAADSQNVTYLESPTSNPVIHDNQQQTQWIVFSSLAAAFVIITVTILILYKRKHSLPRAYIAPVGLNVL